MSIKGKIRSKRLNIMKKEKKHYSVGFAFYPALFAIPLWLSCKQELPPDWVRGPSIFETLKGQLDTVKPSDLETFYSA